MGHRHPHAPSVPSGTNAVGAASVSAPPHDCDCCRLSTQPACTSNDGGSATPGSYVITCSGAASDFYGPFGYAAGTLRVGSAPTTTAVLATPNPAPFGSPVTITATVAATGSSAIPTGKVQFSNGSAPLGLPVTLDSAGKAKLTLKALNPGQTITAVYTPSNLNFASSAAAVSRVISFTRTYTGSIGSALNLTNGTYLLTGVTLGGTLTVGAGASVVVLNSTLKGNVVVKGANAISICGSTTEGAVNISGALGFVLIGGPTEHGCALNALKGNVALATNTAGVHVEGNRFGAALTVNGSTGTGGLPSDTAPKIKANTIAGNLACSSNTPPPSNDGARNSVGGSRTGQCAAL